ncbi:hypothetical protein M9Y10_016508 [Tritrichomonas musculus]|uniref:Uncharacterized protein n=1 Tax=Tritrichomonas musculus TaxID=1915356 RepID=A0ABR2HWF0_9EUKA
MHIKKIRHVIVRIDIKIDPFLSLIKRLRHLERIDSQAVWCVWVNGLVAVLVNVALLEDDVSLIQEVALVDWYVNRKDLLLQRGCIPPCRIHGHRDVVPYALADIVIRDFRWFDDVALEQFDVPVAYPARRPSRLFALLNHVDGDRLPIGRVNA